MPFELELAARNSETVGRSGATDLRSHEKVTAVQCLSVNAPQILGNETDRRRLLLKPKKLRMIDVSLRLSREYGLGKKTFTPQSNQSAGVEVLRMQAPDTHYYLSAAQRSPSPAADERSEEGTKRRSRLAVGCKALFGGIALQRAGPPPRLACQKARMTTFPGFTR